LPRQAKKRIRLGDSSQTIIYLKAAREKTLIYKLLGILLWKYLPAGKSFSGLML
jgi:hypothetical protein